jgi:hypothetical protein
MTTVLATIRDTVIPASMPIDNTYQGVLAYRDGPYRWSPQEARRFHDAGKLIFPISVEGSNAHLAQVADCEHGDLTVAQAADWARRRNQLHHDATIYASRATIMGGPRNSLLEALGDEPCWLWLAWWTNHFIMPSLALPPHIKVAAVQYQNLPKWDLSMIISPDWPASPYNDVAHW